MLVAADLGLHDLVLFDALTTHEALERLRRVAVGIEGGGPLRPLPKLGGVGFPSIETLDLRDDPSRRAVDEDVSVAEGGLSELLGELLADGFNGRADDVRGKLFDTDLEDEHLGCIADLAALVGGSLDGLRLTHEWEAQLLATFDPEGSGVSHETTHGGERLRAFGGGDGAAGIHDVERVRRLQDVAVGRHGKACFDHAGRFGDERFVERAVRVDGSVVEVVAAHLIFLLTMSFAVLDLASVGGDGVDDVLEVRDALQRHDDALHAVGEFDGDRVQVLAAHLLEVGELGDFHAVEPDFPAEAPRADGGLLPVVLDEPHVVLVEVDAKRFE